MRAEWRGRADFAEVAEALQIETSQVLLIGPTPVDGTIVVVFTPEHDDELLHSVLMRRLDDGILACMSVPRPHPGAWEQITDEIERGFKGH